MTSLAQRAVLGSLLPTQVRDWQKEHCLTWAPESAGRGQGHTILPPQSLTRQTPNCAAWRQEGAGAEQGAAAVVAFCVVMALPSALSTSHMGASCTQSSCGDGGALGFLHASPHPGTACLPARAKDPAPKGPPSVRNNFWLQAVSVGHRSCCLFPLAVVPLFLMQENQIFFQT